MNFVSFCNTLRQIPIISLQNVSSLFCVYVHKTLDIYQREAVLSLNYYLSAYQLTIWSPMLGS